MYRFAIYGKSGIVITDNKSNGVVNGTVLRIDGRYCRAEADDLIEKANAVLDIFPTIGLENIFDFVEEAYWGRLDYGSHN